jgi:hypothetical protein
MQDLYSRYRFKSYERQVHQHRHLVLQRGQQRGGPRVLIIRSAAPPAFERCRSTNVRISPEMRIEN